MADLITDDDVLVFTEGGTVTHVLPRCESPNNAGSDALCGRTSWPVGWYGTGTQDEYEKARELTLCIRCAAVLRHQRMGATTLDCD